MQPKLIVFDLDFTLWDCGGTYCDCLSPDFVLQSEQVVDRLGHVVRLFDDVPEIMDSCDENGIVMALASRTQEPEWARELIRLLGIAHRFEFSEIYPSSKLVHFRALHDASGIDYQEMLFFDDEMRNIDEVSRLGVTSIYVKHGIRRKDFDKGITEFLKRSR